MYLLFKLEPSEWKGSVSLGADISLPHCLATGIWTLAPKAITGPKSRETSFGTTLWHHAQRYCANFPLFMQIMWSTYSLLRWGKFIRRLGLSVRAENLASLSCTSHYEGFVGMKFYFTLPHFTPGPTGEMTGCLCRNVLNFFAHAWRNERLWEDPLKSELWLGFMKTIQTTGSHSEPNKVAESLRRKLVPVCRCCSCNIAFQNM